MTAREQLLDELRPLAFRVAYRMLGSVSEAEDIVQEALLRVHQALDGGEQIASPQAFVTTVATRLAIDELRSARARRELYVGEWLPEPIVTDDPEDPARQAEIADSISMAMLLVLESLTPEERAAFLLHDAFDYPYREIAPIIGKSEDNVRQLASRARRHIGEHRPRFQTTREHQDELARRFFAAAESGDLAELEALLADDVVLTGDGGGKAPALARSLTRPRAGGAHAAQLVDGARTASPAASPSTSSRSTAARARWRSMPTGEWRPCWRSRSTAARSPA